MVWLARDSQALPCAALLSCLAFKLAGGGNSAGGEGEGGQPYYKAKGRGWNWGHLWFLQNSLLLASNSCKQTRVPLTPRASIHSPKGKEYMAKLQPHQAVMGFGRESPHV